MRSVDEIRRLKQILLYDFVGKARTRTISGDDGAGRDFYCYSSH